MKENWRSLWGKPGVSQLHLHGQSGGQDPPSDETERAELFPKVSSAGSVMPTKGQSPGLKKMHKRNHFSLLWNWNDQKVAFLFSHRSNNGTSLLLRMFVPASHSGLWCYIALKMWWWEVQRGWFIKWRAHCMLQVSDSSVTPVSGCSNICISMKHLANI